MIHASLITLIAFTFLSQANAETFPNSRRTLAPAAGGCKIDYVDSKGFRSLKKICGTKESDYFKLNDQTAPLLEGKEFKIRKKSYLGTRWATGHGEEVVVFDLAAKSAHVTSHVISDGPSSMTLDSAKSKIKIGLIERKGVGAEATGTQKFVYVPGP